MRLKWLFLISLAALILVIAPQMTQAQADIDVCPVLVQQALEQMGDSCAGMERNNACYGFNRVDSTFVETMPTDFFTETADRARLAQVESLTTAPLDLSIEQWGVAVMNVQANIPSSLPGQAVVFMLMGDTEVKNTVPPDEMVDPIESVNLTTLIETQVFSGPAYNTNVRATVAADTLLPADGMSEDGQWLQILSENGLGWVRREVFGNVPGIDVLPLVKEHGQTPMQSFQVRTAFDDLLCNEAPSLLAIQSPEGLKVDLNANGVHIHMGSLVMLRTVPPGNAIQAITIEGDVVLDPGTPHELPLPAGYLTQRCLDDNNMVYDDCGWLPPLPMTEIELQWAQLVLEAYARLGNPNMGSFVVGGENFTLIDTDSCPAGMVVNHSVQPGDNLFQLGLLYGTTSQTIMADNNLPNTNIAVGQTLEIVCGAQGPSQLPSLGAPPVSFIPQAPPEPPPPPVDCSSFRATSPLDGIAYGTETFYWDAAPGATAYRVNLVGESGVFSFTTDGSNLNLNVDTSNSSIGFGFQMQWNVEAIFEGEVICTTPLVSIPREPQPPGRPAPQQPPPPQRDPQCDLICDGEFCYDPCQPNF